MSQITVNKGDYIEAEYFEFNSFAAALAGVQLKTSTSAIHVSGIVRHVRSDSATKAINPTFHIEHEKGKLCSKCNIKELEIKPCMLTKVNDIYVQNCEIE